MAEEIKTPRTDALVQWMKESKFSNLEGRNVFSGTSIEVISAEECRQLERELTLVTQERDALREKLNEAYERAAQIANEFDFGLQSGLVEAIRSLKRN